MTFDIGEDIVKVVMPRIYFDILFFLFVASLVLNLITSIMDIIKKRLEDKLKKKGILS